MNIKELSRKLGLDEEDYRSLLDLFIQTADSDIKTLRDAINKHNSGSAVETAHSLKGSAGNMGFMDIYILAGEIEVKSGKKQFDPLAEKTDQLEALLASIKELLKK